MKVACPEFHPQSLEESSVQRRLGRMDEAGPRDVEGAAGMLAQDHNSRGLRTPVVWRETTHGVT